MSTILCTHEVLRTTIAALRHGGEYGEERVALWISGASTRALTAIEEVYEPNQVAEFDYFRLPSVAMRLLMKDLRSTRRRIAAQIHTHPRRAFHSDVDAEWAIIRHVGALSLVLPRFAKTTTPENFLTEVMTYEYSPTGEWVHCPNHGPDARVRIIA
jgi:hypothetical protein